MVGEIFKKDDFAFSSLLMLIFDEILGKLKMGKKKKKHERAYRL